MFATLLLLQAAPVAAIESDRSPELDAANDCLVAKTGVWLREYDWRPEKDERWRWATRIVDQCAAEVRASSASLRDPDSPVRKLAERGAQLGNISNYDLRRSEALYYVDGMIRAHFEERAQ